VLDLGGAAGAAHAADREPPSSAAIAAVTDTLRTLRGDGVDPATAELIEPVRMAALDTIGPDRSPRPDSLPHARFMLLAESWQAVTLGHTSGTTGINALVWTDLQQAAATTLASLGGEADKTEVMLLQRPRGQADTAAAADAAQSWRRPAATLRALAVTTTDLVTRLGLFGEGSGWATQYLATAERFGSPRDKVRALALLARCQVATGAFAVAQESIERGLALVPAIATAPSPAAEMLEDDLAISRQPLAHYVDGDWPALLKSLPTSGEYRPAGLLLAAWRSLASRRADRASDASALLETLLPAVAEEAPLTLYRDAALVVTVAAAWELGAAEHAGAGLGLVGRMRNAGAGGQPEASLDLTQARLLAMAGRMAESRAAFAAARTTATAAGLLPQLALADYDEAVAIAAAGPRNYGEALGLLATAGEKFERLGMRGWSGRVSALTLTSFKEATEPGGRLFFTYPRGLSRSEADLVRLMARGARPNEVATELGIDKAQVEKLTAAALKKLRGKSADEFPQLARKYGLGGL
jgi:DNA-binding CsgD family transcriptional regulator